ncbi:hypothetical protein [Nocardiopsis trehalosi]|uniref:hypothetical protein n=1 Tax=Nocardiopsis trehalosi TaxID=109329 RepID=UPI0012F9B460|nr:hypothetical protein [Nocardiopsis trehalosi]
MAPWRASDDRCLHDLLPDQCSLCVRTPSGLVDRVVVSGGGAVFHRSVSCAALREGRPEVERRGGDLADVHTVPLARVLHERSPCKTCFPDHTPPGTELCWVRAGHVWHPALLTQWTPDRTGAPGGLRPRGRLPPRDGPRHRPPPPGGPRPA